MTPEQQARYQDPDCIREILRTAKTIAMVGLSADRQKASYFVATYLQHEGYRIIPVNPRGGTILGETVYPDLKSIPVQVDLVDVFRPADEVPAIVDQAIAIGAKAVWTQLRIVDLEAAEKALAAGPAGGHGQMREDGTWPLLRQPALGRHEHRDHLRAAGRTVGRST